MEMKKNDPLELPVNRVAESGLMTINLEHFYPDAPFYKFDLKPFLFHELILKEKEFREAMKRFDWQVMQDHILLVTCSADAVIPLWAYMLIASHAQPYAKDIFLGDQPAYLDAYYHKCIAALPLDEYRDQRIVIKGCSEKPVPAGAYAALTHHLRPVARSIFFGEPCSTVPIYKAHNILKG